MATALSVRINYVDADVAYTVTPADYITLNLTNDYLIWSKTLADLMTHEPTADELNAAAEIIDPSLAVTVAKCLLMDYSHDVGGSYYTHLVKGMSENKKFVYCFSFDGATATEPQLEAWDTSAHTTYVKHVLGAGTPANSMMKGVCTTTTLPGVGWAGTALAGASNVLLLNDGSGALVGAASLYSNLKIVIPAAYVTPAAETFVLTCRYTYV
jgi:hypothetical protein